MRVLLDTHLLLWALASPSKLSSKARQRIESSEVFASAASIWEISIKSALGKLEANPAEVLSGIEAAGFDHLPISGEHAAEVVDLPHLHKDPFDRLLVAQARVERMILLTDDDTLGGYGNFVQVV
ncbi:MAG TPA: type II toxin-antitoxin system VapC family toxin [Steroidobacteraceae bacterium]|nr:type II toxin-antitoxin system VapC family toxin [Steroidobacteraceae bacterium]